MDKFEFEGLYKHYTMEAMERTLAKGRESAGLFNTITQLSQYIVGKSVQQAWVWEARGLLLRLNRLRALIV